MNKVKALFMVMLIIMSVTVTLADDTNDVNPETDRRLIEVIQDNISQDIKTVYNGEKIRIECEFAKPIVEKGVYDKVKVKSLRSHGKAGEPDLPFKTLNILLPQGKTVQSIEVTGNEIHLPDEYRVEYGQEPVPIGSKIKYRTLPDPAIYESMNPFPGKKFTEVSIEELRGYRILILNLHPIQYIPKAGKISYFDNISVIINTVPETVNSNFRGLPQDRMQVLDVIDNPEVVETYGTSAQTLSQPYDYVIITTDSFVSAFQPLADWKNQKGVNTTIVTVEDIYVNYSGVDKQEKIRNFIKDAYHNWSIEYVLLGGDGDGDDVGGESGDTIIPHRGFYGYAGGYTDYDIPADLYYAALDGNWNNDNDNMWGEPGEDDLLAEVYIGRAPVDSEAEVSNFVMKTIAYESTNAPYLREALMVGEDLSWAVWGGEYKDEIKDGSSAWGHTTVGFPEEYNVSTLYDRDLNPDRWNKNDLIPIINDGVHIINHLGHANVGYVMKMSNSDVDAFTNEEYFFGYSQGCYDGSFDNRGTSASYYSYDCISEHLTTTPHGAFAFIGNSRYGWGSGSNTNGASQYYDREFYDALFGENILNIGKANQDSKEDNIGLIGNSVMRWCYYEINLFGDPETQIWRIPKSPELSVNVEAPAKVNNYSTFAVTATISNVGTETVTSANISMSWNPEMGLNTTDPLTKSVGDILGGDSEIVSWNIDASSEEIYNITVEASATNTIPANYTTTVEVVLPDLTPPTVALQSPEDNAIVGEGNILFQYIPDDTQSGISNCELIINGNISVIDDTIMEGYINNFTALMTAGNYTWNVNCTDDSPDANEVCGTERTLIVEDRTPPVWGFILIHDGVNGYTNDNEPDLYLFTEGADYMAFSGNNTSFSDWINYDEFYTDFNVETGAGCTQGDGPKTIYVKFKDKAGNEGAYANDITILDKTAPADGYITIIDNDDYTNDSEPKLNLSAVGADYMAFSCNNTSFSNWINYEGFYTDFNVETGAGCTQGDGPKTIYVKFKDEAGNEGAYANDITILDKAAPVDGYISIIDNYGYTNDNESDLDLSAIGADYMAFSCNNIDFCDWIANTTSYSSFNMETGAGCSEGDGLKTIYVKYKDKAGNEGAYANDTTILDRTAPVISKVISSGIMRTSATIEWTTDELSNSVINYNSTTPLEKSVSDVSMVKNHSVTLTDLSPGETYYYEVRSTDFIDNTAIENNSGNYYTFTTLSVFPKTITLSPVTAVGSGVNDVITEVQVSDDTYATLNVKKAEGYVEMNFLTDIPEGSIINSMIFSYEHHETVDNAVYVEVWNGSTWVRHGGTISSSDTTDSVDVKTEAENSTIKYVCYDEAGGPEKCYLDHAELSITYTPPSHQLPELSVVVTSLPTVNVNDTFIANVVISNLGDEPATGVNAIIALPVGLSTDDSPSKFIGNIAGRDSSTASWNVSANTIGTYNITVNASATNTANASGNTTIGVVNDSNTMHVANIDMSLSKKTAGPNFFTRAIAIVSIVDANGIPVSGATVSGHWSIATSDFDSGMTDTNGNISLYSDEVKNAPPGTNFTFTVDNVVGGLTYNPGGNIETEDNIVV